jgi:hypothetical protein
VELVYPTEGTPQIVGPNGFFKAAPNRSAARLFQCFCFTPSASSSCSISRAFLVPSAVKEKPGRRPLRDIKVMREDAVAVEKYADESRPAPSRFSMCENRRRSAAQKRGGQTIARIGHRTALPWV